MDLNKIKMFLFINLIWIRNKSANKDGQWTYIISGSKSYTRVNARA